jgi:hypothetical protein
MRCAYGLSASPTSQYEGMGGTRANLASRAERPSPRRASHDEPELRWLGFHPLQAVSMGVGAAVVGVALTEATFT